MDNPYSEAQLRGRVTERRRDSDFKYIDAVSRKYVGKAWPYREEAPVALVIEIDKVHYSKQPAHTRSSGEETSLADARRISSPPHHAKNRSPRRAADMVVLLSFPPRVS